MALPKMQAQPQPRTLTVSVVAYRPDLPTLGATLRSLRDAAAVATEARYLRHVHVDLIDNGSDAPDAVDATARSALGSAPWMSLRILRGHGNVGYGRGHNLSILSSESTYHLVLNPDVLVDRDALVEGVRFLEQNPDVGLVAPHVRGEDGQQQYLCRAYPSLFLLYLRGFAPSAVQRLFRRYMEAHELRDRIGDQVVRDVPLISGCFMFGRRDVLCAVGGFSPAYFLYFEDSDLSIAVSRVSSLAYVPTVRIVHFGGGAARKGVSHIRMFVTAAATFFRRNGWRFV